MNILYRRVNLNDINEILHLFNQVFKSKLSKEYYLSKYLEIKKINSFVAVNDKKIIGHVGFIRNKIHPYKNKIYKVYSRHTSMISKKFRKKGIYRDLCNFAYKKLKNSDVLGIITFPNKANLLAYNKNYKNIDLRKKLLYSYFCQKKNIKIKNKKLNINFVRKIIKIRNKISFFQKNILFYKKNYLKIKNNKFYFFSKNNFYIIYNCKLIKKNIHINILEHSEVNESSVKFFNLFIKSFNDMHIINIWFDLNLQTSNKIIKDLGFKKTNKIFNINLIPFKSFVYNLIENFDNNDFSMGDTDVFHVID